MPEIAKKSGIRYSSIFCCLANGLSSAAAGMFFIISWRCVVNVVADISDDQDDRDDLDVEVGAEPMKVADSWAPKIVELLGLRRERLA